MRFFSKIGKVFKKISRGIRTTFSKTKVSEKLPDFDEPLKYSVDFETPIEQQLEQEKAIVENIQPQQVRALKSRIEIYRNEVFKQELQFTREINRLSIGENINNDKIRALQGEIQEFDAERFNETIAKYYDDTLTRPELNAEISRVRAKNIRNVFGTERFKKRLLNELIKKEYYEKLEAGHFDRQGLYSGKGRPAKGSMSLNRWVKIRHDQLTKSFKNDTEAKIKKVFGSFKSDFSYDDV